jgi:hypothetical protein
LINFRYHIVSIVAVFLALGLGILLGSSVVSDPLGAQLNEDLVIARRARETAESERNTFETEVRTLRNRLNDAAAWVVDSRLDGRRILFVADRSNEDLAGHVRRPLVAGGAESAGLLELSDRLRLPDAADRQELVDAVTAIVPSCEEGVTEDCFDEEGDVGASALALIGERFREPVGRVLIDSLVERGFMAAPEKPDGEWPPTDATVVILASGRSADAEPLPGLVRFAREVAEGAPTLVASAGLESESLVSDLRDENNLPDTLSTFDAATDETDPGGVGVFAAMIAATEGRGGHFGEVDPFIAPAPGPE